MYALLQASILVNYLPRSRLFYLYASVHFRSTSMVKPNRSLTLVNVTRDTVVALTMAWSALKGEREEKHRRTSLWRMAVGPVRGEKARANDGAPCLSCTSLLHLPMYCSQMGDRLMWLFAPFHGRAS